ncbi:hypothetical protein MKW98_031008 [Papaver atlanticum]|uniref:Uncharacterized protein n=1 Tax=Papaver atlanticum TaxID=357466 RepID=A0AAD4S7L8_9MAGN|nr:hypothetical protein MKW98_031008 [Papaver atlanticum]
MKLREWKPLLRQLLGKMQRFGDGDTSQICLDLEEESELQWGWHQHVYLLDYLDLDQLH